VRPAMFGGRYCHWCLVDDMAEWLDEQAMYRDLAHGG
jgi:hypothetical protein